MTAAAHEPPSAPSAAPDEAPRPAAGTGPVGRVADGARPCSGQRLTVALVGCGKSKRDQAAPARDLYTGDLFSKASRYVEHVADRWYVLSAEHGLVHPDTVLSPYERSMRDLTSGDARDRWARRVDLTLRTSDSSLTAPSMSGLADPDDLARLGLGAFTMYGGQVSFVVLAGVDYRQPLLPVLNSWASTCAPLEGLGIGQQKQWLLAHTR